MLSLRAGQWPGVSVQGLHARLSEDAPGPPHLVMQIAQLHVASLGWHRVGLQLDGHLRSDGAGRWHFDGQLLCRGAPGGSWSHAQLALLVDALANSLFVRLSQGPSQLTMALPLDQPSHWQVHLQQLPASWLHLLPGEAVTPWASRGWLSGELALDQHDDGLQASGMFHAQGLSLELPALGLSTDALSGSAQLNLALDAAGHVQHAQLQSQLQQGGWNFQGWRGRLDGTAGAQLALQAAPAARGGLGLELHWIDPGAAHFEAQLQLDPHGRLRELQLQHLGLNLAQAYLHYADTLAGLPWASRLQLGGQLVGSLAWRAGSWSALSLRLHDMVLQGPGLPLAVQGLQGGIEWRLHGQAAPASLAWQQLTLGDQPQPPGQLAWQSRDGQLHLLSNWRLALWGGQLSLNSLALMPQGAGLGWVADADLQDLQIGALWRYFGGLDGSLSLAQKHVLLHGDLRRAVVDVPLLLPLWHGQLQATGLRLSRPASGAPLQLQADLQLRQIDLQALASALKLGTASGTLDGQIDGLQVQAGSGVQAFQAQLHSNGGRLGQPLLNLLAVLTGSTAGNGLSGMMLHWFHSPAYQQLGLQARLQDGQLYLDGLDHDSHGYTVLHGRSLPLLRMVGRDTRLTWAQALHRWRLATAGHGAGR